MTCADALKYPWLASAPSAPQCLPLYHPDKARNLSAPGRLTSQHPLPITTPERHHTFMGVLSTPGPHSHPSPVVSPVHSPYSPYKIPPKAHGVKHPRASSSLDVPSPRASASPRKRMRAEDRDDVAGPSRLRARVSYTSLFGPVPSDVVPGLGLFPY